MESDEQMILENIDEYVNDEDKIVTYKWLSLTLSINASKSKSLLEEYVKKNEALDIVYFLAGLKIVDSKKCYYCTLAKKSSLDDVKTQFENLTSCHIYSIQKSPVMNVDVLYNNDVEVTRDKLSELYKCNSIRCEQAENVDTLKIRRNQPVPHKAEIKPQLASVNSKNDDIKKEVKKESPPLSFFGKKTSGKKVEPKNKERKEEKTEVKEKQNEKVNSKPSIANAFSKSSTINHQSKRNESCKQTDTTKTPKDDKHVQSSELLDSTVTKSSEPLDSTVAKTKELTPDNHPVVTNKDVSKKRKIVSSEESESDDDFEKFVAKSKDTNVVSKNTEQCTKKTLTKKVKKNIQEEEEEEDTFVDVEDVDIVAPTPEPVKPKTKRRKKQDNHEKDSTEKIDKKSPSPPVKIKKAVAEVEESSKSMNTASLNGSKKRGRRRVLKSKQFINEEGYMVTQKAYESESYSEDSETEISEEKMKILPVEAKQKIESKKTMKELETKATLHSKKSKHQSSLTNFFKKKQ